MGTVFENFKELNNKVIVIKDKYENTEDTIKKENLKELMKVVDYHEKYIYEINKILIDNNDIPEILYNFDRLKQRILEMKDILEKEKEEARNILENKLKNFQAYHVEFKKSLNNLLK